ncbi:hypothetical protein OS493_007071 [Desmophyllum pertusum]|uniref:Kazal-like domain-containing protein n=1 Tax=Desmophyllum pertusum TaxID=174260 RepID=A0A9W9ZFC8_9CNID|nr:hypothetical protein OS493_007071 [Desmophyllum pertusum]
MAGLVMGIALIPGCGGGIFLGGLIVRRFTIKESLFLAARFCLIFKALTALGSLVWTFPGCEEVQLAGIVKPYWDSPTMDNSLVSTCNRNCSCPLSQIRPVCGADKLTYFSPCFCRLYFINYKGVHSKCSCLFATFQCLRT